MNQIQLCTNRTYWIVTVIEITYYVLRKKDNALLLKFCRRQSVPVVVCGTQIVKTLCWRLGRRNNAARVCHPNLPHSTISVIAAVCRRNYPPILPPNLLSALQPAQFVGAFISHSGGVPNKYLAVGYLFTWLRSKKLWFNNS